MTYFNVVHSEAFDELIPVWDIQEQQVVYVRPYIIFLAGDNPMQAEECSSTGPRSNHPCHTCKVGGTRQFKASNGGYSDLFNVSCYRWTTNSVLLRNPNSLGLSVPVRKLLKLLLSSTSSR